MYFKSDFTVILASEAQWGGCPFRIKLWTASPAEGRSITACFDGTVWHNCQLLSDGRLQICVNQGDLGKNQYIGIGTLKMDIEFYLSNADFNDHICNEHIRTFEPVFVDEDGEEYRLYLGADGASTITTIGTLPAFYQRGEKGDKGDKGDTGEQGPVGPIGPQGIQGIQGEKGDKGDKGDQGIQGEVGPRGEKGDKGDAFKYSDFTPEQLEGLRGPRGFQGEKGDKGDQGIQGIQGEVGPVGPRGATGPQGPQGIQGIQGEKGDKGDKGDPGDSVTFFPAVTIFGQPHIEGPQISGFSANDYLQFPFVVNFAGRPWELHFDIATGAEVNQQHNIFDSNFGLAFAFANGHFVMAMSSNGTSWDLGANEGTHAILPNQTYHIRMSWDGSIYKLEFSTDEVTWTTDITVASTASLYPRQIVIGKDIFTGTHFYNGSINFAHAQLKIAGLVVWEGMEEIGVATRMAIDMSNIDEEGKQKLNEVAMEGEVGKKLGDLSAEADKLEANVEGIIDVDILTDYISAQGSGFKVFELNLAKGKEYAIKVETKESPATPVFVGIRDNDGNIVLKDKSINNLFSFVPEYDYINAYIYTSSTEAIEVRVSVKKSGDAKKVKDDIERKNVSVLYFQDGKQPSFQMSATQLTVSFPDAFFRIYSISNGIVSNENYNYKNSTFTLNGLERLIYNLKTKSISVVNRADTMDDDLIELLSRSGDSIDGVMSPMYYTWLNNQNTNRIDSLEKDVKMFISENFISGNGDTAASKDISLKKGKYLLVFYNNNWSHTSKTSPTSLLFAVQYNWKDVAGTAFYADSLPSELVFDANVEGIYQFRCRADSGENVKFSLYYISGMYAKKEIDDLLSLVKIELTKNIQLLAYDKLIGNHFISVEGFVQGGLYNGNLDPAQNNIVTTELYYPVCNNNKVWICDKSHSSFKHRVTWYGEDKKYIGNSGSYSTGDTFDLPAGAKYYRLSFQTTTGSTLAPDDIKDETIYVAIEQDRIYDTIRPVSHDIVTNDTEIARVRQVIEKMSRTPNSRLVTFLHMSDIHRNVLNLNRIDNFRKKFDYFDDILSSGDQVEEQFAEDYSWWNTLGDAIVCLGNHEVWKSDHTGQQEADPVDAQSCYNKYFSPYISSWGVEYNEGKCYFYKDYNDAKVRLIVLDQIHYDSVQNSWFVSTLNDAKDNDLTVIVMGHYASGDYANFSNNTDCAFSTLIRSNTGWAPPAIANGRMLQEQVVLEFMQNGGSFALWIAGHTHADMFGKSEHGVPTLILESASEDRSVDYRALGSNTQDSFNIMTIDTTNKKIYVYRVGDNIDNMLRRKEVMCYDYENQKIM